MLAQIFKQHEATAHLYQPTTDSKVVRQLVKARNEIYLDSETPVSHAITIAKEIDHILKYIDNVDMELPRYGV